MKNTYNLSNIIIFLAVLLVSIIVYWTPVQATAIEVPRISIHQAKQMVDDPDVVFIDVRTEKSYWRSASKIKRAVREEPNAVIQWAAKYTKDKTLIFYCT